MHHDGTYVAFLALLRGVGLQIDAANGDVLYLGVDGNSSLEFYHAMGCRSRGHGVTFMSAPMERGVAGAGAEDVALRPTCCENGCGADHSAPTNVIALGP